MYTCLTSMESLIAVIFSELQELDDSSSELSSSEDEDEIVLSFSFSRISGRDSVTRVVCYAENIVPLFSDRDFKSHFRMNKSTFEILVNKLRPNIVSCRGRPNVEPGKQVMMTIWLLANQESFRSIADRYDVSKSTLSLVSTKVSNELSALSREIILWPTLPGINTIKRNFEAMGGFPGVIGAIDGCHIPIKAPSAYQDSYVNRKGFHAIILQAVVDNELLFIDCYIGEAGSLHDARVFRRSHLGRELHNLVPSGYHLLGDSAYPLSRKVMTPFKDNGHLSRAQRNYNTSLSKTRSTVERAFALLKGRFRRLKYMDVHRTDLLPMLVGACCVMHNMCQKRGDFIEIDEEEDDDDIDDDDDDIDMDDQDIANGHIKRNELLALFQ